MNPQNAVAAATTTHPSRTKNHYHLRNYWRQAIEDPHLRLIVVSTAEPQTDRKGETPLSPPARHHAEAYGRTIMDIVQQMFINSGADLIAVRAERHKNTIEALIPPDFRRVCDVETPKELGPPAEGQRPLFYRANLARELIRRIDLADGRIVIYSGLSPEVNEALEVGVTGVLAPMETLFLGCEGQRFVLLGRIAPEFTAQ